nr:reverse transcriptase domain-containing protein [Tanacetum cinerariifolium]
MIKEHSQQAKIKATPRKLAYVDSNKEALAGSLARGFSDRFSLDSSGTPDTHKQTCSASKSRRTPSKNKDPTHLRRSRRLKDRSITHEKARMERSQPKGKSSGHQETSSDSKHDEGSEDAYEDLNSPYKRPKPTPFTQRITRFKCHKLPRNIRVYEGNKDPEDHLGIFSAMVEKEEWPMPVWYKMFRQTLGGAARNWFDDPDPKSVDSFEELSQKFLEEFSQQKRRWTKCLKESGPSLEEKWPLDHHKWSVLLKGTKGIFIRYGPEDLKKLEIEAAREKHEETWGLVVVYILIMSVKPPVATLRTYTLLPGPTTREGMFPSNTEPKPMAYIKAITKQSGIVLDGHSVPPSPPSSKEVERDPKIIMDQRNPHQPSIPYPSRLNKDELQDKSDIQTYKFLQMFKKLHFNISLAKALDVIPKYYKMFKDLLSDKEKLLGLANTSLTDNCSAVFLKKLSEKFEDPGRYLIPCDFHRLESCMALADLGASINLMPISVWKKLSLPDLTPTRITLNLATRSIAYPAGRLYRNADSYKGYKVHGRRDHINNRLQTVFDKSSAGKHGAEPVVHKRRPMTPDRRLVLKEKVFRRLMERMIRKVRHPVWVANTIPVKLPNGPGSQIRMTEDDEEKTGFHTEEEVYCFTHMPKDLKNSLATL